MGLRPQSPSLESSIIIVYMTLNNETAAKHLLNEMEGYDRDDHA